MKNITVYVCKKLYFGDYDILQSEIMLVTNDIGQAQMFVERFKKKYDECKELYEWAEYETFTMNKKKRNDD